MTAPDPSTVRYPGPWTHRDIHANGIRLHAVEAGPTHRGAPLVVFVHGFADLWWSWRHQLTAFADAGYHAVAVDLRGYGDSDKPPRGYDGWTLSNDIAGLIRALGYTEATLVGHADGGLVCWATAVLHPGLVRAIAVVDSPHPISLRDAAIRDRAQRRALLPTFLTYQLPWRPERRLVRDGGREIARLVRMRSGPEWSRTAEFGEVVDRLRAAICIPGAAHCALEYQRWAFRSQWRPDGRRFMKAMDATLTLPVLQLHGSLDPYVMASTLRRCVRHAPGRIMKFVDGAGHYAHQEYADEVSAELLAFARGL
ncbi:alpha/beta fold hydrolase [Rhodococcus chondri]|uniref:Alpha/beta hydrolase n=1 Tax=Rhodococcus chondri TaxID=3065941 RepID=A0ABU7JWD9_9NOCA|nr:alpha/beta hydrolase [Rhodococcus sp. CC-R104]MEE2034326.1 alpha/beta hydrolase [Rhodococcus sp. CC-R104]